MIQSSPTIGPREPRVEKDTRSLDLLKVLSPYILIKVAAFAFLGVVGLLVFGLAGIVLTEILFALGTWSIWVFYGAVTVGFVVYSTRQDILMKKAP